MKKITLLAVLFSTFMAFAQVPQKMSYQAVVRDSNNALVVSTAIGMELSIVQGSVTGTAVYSETHSTTTNSNGFIILEIGNGNVISGNFAAINWANGPYFIKTQADLSGGSNYTITGASELLSVPYALYAAQSEIPPGNAVGDIQYWNGSSWVFLPIGTPGSVLKVSSDNVPQWTSVQGAAVSVTTNPVTAITALSAIFDSTITNTENAFILASGYFFGTSINPDLGDTVTTTTPTTVLPNTTYHVRAFVTTVAGTVYGNDVVFSTPSGIASVTTTPITSTDFCSISSGGTITANGGEPIQETGVCYSKTPNPTVESNYISSPGETASFTTQLTGLEPNTQYYYRAVASNGVGYFYGNELTFTTPNPISLTTSFVSTGVCKAKVKVVGTLASSSTFESVGVLYGTTPNSQEYYGVSDDNAVGASTVNSELQLTNLVSNTTYYARSYATVCGTMIFGNEISFTTTTPSVSITATTVEQVSMCQARFSFTYSGNEDVIISKRMFYGTSVNPTAENSMAYNFNESNPFYSNQLIPNTVYHLRARITICDGTEIYGPDVTFTTPNKITSITTNPVTEITNGTAMLNGTLIGNNIDSSSPGFCYSTNPNPTIANSILSLGYGFADGNSYSKMLQGLSANTTYYIRAYTKVENNCVNEVIYGNQVSFTTSSGALAVGQNYQGGIIFWLNAAGTGGLIAAETDQGTAQWGCMGTQISGTSAAVESGDTNTSAIISGCATPGIAARLCDNLVLNGKSDWYLPSEAELLLISQLNYFPVVNYWSSTQASSTQARYVNGYVSGSSDKTQTDFKVRAVRSF